MPKSEYTNLQRILKNARTQLEGIYKEMDKEHPRHRIKATHLRKQADGDSVMVDWDDMDKMRLDLQTIIKELEEHEGHNTLIAKLRSAVKIIDGQESGQRHSVVFHREAEAIQSDLHELSSHDSASDEAQPRHAVRVPKGENDRLHTILDEVQPELDRIYKRIESYQTRHHLHLMNNGDRGDIIVLDLAALDHLKFSLEKMIKEIEVQNHGPIKLLEAAVRIIVRETKRTTGEQQYVASLKSLENDHSLDDGINRIETTASSPSVFFPEAGHIEPLTSAQMLYPETLTGFAKDNSRDEFVSVERAAPIVSISKERFPVTASK